MSPTRYLEPILAAALAGFAAALLVAALLAVIYTSWWAPVLAGAGWFCIEARHRLELARGGSQ